jgi:3-oxoacid CoA-transferase subunit A
MEHAFQADFAIVKAWKGDEAGNLVLTARNFNPCMAEQQKITIAEVEELLPAGSLDPNEIHIPGILVSKKYEKRIEQLTVRKFSNHGFR